MSVSITDFGAVGDDATDNQAFIEDAIDYCVTNGVTLTIPDGIYRHSGTIEWAWPNFKVLAVGANVVLKHTGTGRANDFNGLTHGSSTEGVSRCVFGGANRITCKGNPAGGTTQVVYVNNWNFSRMNVAPRDGQFAFIGENSGMGAAAAVESVFEIFCTPNVGDTFAVVPDYGMYLSDLPRARSSTPLLKDVAPTREPESTLPVPTGTFFWAALSRAA